MIYRGGLLKPPPCPIRVKDSTDIQISIFWPLDYRIKSHKNCLLAIMADIIWERPLMACAQYLKYANSFGKWKTSFLKALYLSMDISCRSLERKQKWHKLEQSSGVMRSGANIQWLAEKLDFLAVYDIKWRYFEWRLHTLKVLLFCFLSYGRIDMTWSF